MLQFFLPYFCSGFGRAGGWLYHAPAEFEHIASSSSSCIIIINSSPSTQYIDMEMLIWIQLHQLFYCLVKGKGKGHLI